MSEKKSKQKFYKDLYGKDYTYYNEPIYDAFREQIESEYPNLYKEKENFDAITKQDKIDQLKIAKSLADDLQLGKVDVVPYEGDFPDLKYEYNKDFYDINKNPTIPDPKSILTQFLGKLNPFKQDVKLTPEERKKVRFILEHPSLLSKSGIPKMYGKYGKIKDFRENRKSGEEVFGSDYEDIQDPREKAASYLNLNPKTLDEMIEAPGTAKIRFQKLQEKLKKEKVLKDAIESIKDQQMMEDAEKEYGK